MPRRTKPGRSGAQGKRDGRRPKAVGKRGEGGPLSEIERTLEDLTAVLDRLDVPAAVIGGIAVIAWGFGRSTIDVDAAVALGTKKLPALLKQLTKAGFEPRIDGAVAFARESMVLLMKHSQTGVAVDVSLAQLDFEEEALRNAVDRPFGAVTIRVPRATDLVAYKMFAARPRDLQDVEELVARGLDIDFHRVESLMLGFDALLGFDRAGDWRRLLARLKAGQRSD